MNENGGQAVVVNRPVMPTVVKATAVAVFGLGGLSYEDGQPVAANNAIEVATYHTFVAEHKQAPASRAVLRAYYQAQLARPMMRPTP